MDYFIENDRLKIYSHDVIFLDVKAVRNANELGFFDRISFWLGNYKEVHLRNSDGLGERIFVNRTSYQKGLNRIIDGAYPVEEHQILYRLARNDGPERGMLNEVLRDVKNRVFTAVLHSDLSFRNLNARWRADKEVIAAAIKVDKKNIAYVTNHRRINKQMAIDVVLANPELFIHLPRKIKEDIHFVKEVAHVINLANLNPLFYRNLNLIEEIIPYNRRIVRLIDDPAIAREIHAKYPPLYLDFSESIKSQLSR
jgi:hypothetical protein